MKASLIALILTAMIATSNAGEPITNITYTATNNCIGCVKGGMGYWNKIRVDFPNVFADRAKMEREVGHTCIKNVFLDELDPERGRHDDPICDDCGIFCELDSI